MGKIQGENSKVKTKTKHNKTAHEGTYIKHIEAALKWTQA